MAKKTTSSAYGMDDYSDVKPMTREQAKERNKRSIAIASVLGFLIVLFYVTTITRLAENLKKMSAAKKKSTQISVPVSVKLSAYDVIAKEKSA